MVFDPSAHMTGGPMDAGTADGGSDAGPPTIAPEAFCPAVAEAYCTNAERCCEHPPAMFDRMRCLDEVETGCTSMYGQTLRTEIDYDPVAAYASLTRGTLLVEACDVGVQNFLIERDGLFGGIVGTIGGGEECTPRSTSATDVSVAVLSCRDGQVCRQVSATYWTCQRPAPDGQPCNFAFDCEHGRCQQARLGLPRLCGPGEPGGSPCAVWQPDECASLACARSPSGGLGFECVALTQDSAYCGYASAD